MGKGKELRDLTGGRWPGNPTLKEMYNILVNAKTIAMVGASSNPERPSYEVMQVLQKAGYHVIPVNPNETEVLGEKAYASLSDIPEPVDIVDVFRRAESTPPVAEEAVKIGAKVLWLQLGIINEEAAEIAQHGGLQVVMDRCIKVMHRKLNVPDKIGLA
ncbi:MAG TPA: CoA-binding protein [Patescibacteria group bacterium]|nr:CoA-binding protein [Patescibacteria group bacterium]